MVSMSSSEFISNNDDYISMSAKIVTLFFKLSPQQKYSLTVCNSYIIYDMTFLWFADIPPDNI